jgi:hypothetical protein
VLLAESISKNDKINTTTLYKTINDSKQTNNKTTVTNMWSHFTDMALKAQKDIQDQANEAATKLQQQMPLSSVMISVRFCFCSLVVAVVGFGFDDICLMHDYFFG